MQSNNKGRNYSRNNLHLWPACIHTDEITRVQQTIHQEGCIMNSDIKGWNILEELKKDASPLILIFILGFIVSHFLFNYIKIINFRIDWNLIIGILTLLIALTTLLYTWFINRTQIIKFEDSETGQLITDISIESGSIISKPVLISKVGKTIYFEADQQGSLVIEVSSDKENWHDHYSSGVAKNRLSSITLSGHIKWMRLIFKTNHYPCSIAYAEIILQ